MCKMIVVSYEIKNNILILRDFCIVVLYSLTESKRINIICCDKKGSEFTMVRIIAFANQKGGVGKTTTAINIGASLAAIKKRVLLIDLDQQGNAGTGLGFVRAEHPQSVYGVIMGTDNIVDNILSKVDLLDVENREYRLRDALQPILDYYDFILLDCPPALGHLTLNALNAADSVIIPLQCEFFALEGIRQLVNTINVVQQKWNPDLRILGVLLTMYDKRYSVTRDVENDVRKTFGDTVFKTVIPRNVRVSEAPSHGKPALFYDFNSTGAQAYLRVATEIVNKLEQEG